MKQLGLILAASLMLSACESNPPAPVIDRLPQSKPTSPVQKPASAPHNSPAAKDTRPDTYTVKKGDNLLRIGLEHGFGYREIAEANNIAPPYNIKVGQVLSFASLKQAAPAANQGENGVVISPVKTETGIVATNTTTNTSTPPVNNGPISEPKATREPYSIEAMNRSQKPAATASKPADTKVAEIKPADTKPTETKPADKPIDAKPADAKPATAGDDDSLTWESPTAGKVIAQFNESSNKGIDIGGSMGQTIAAAAPGKVIYTGADLRGYGKLVIIKHNKTYLSVYAHNSKILVKEGQSVQGGQKIAEMGNTDSNNIKLHFEIRRQGKSVDPSKYLAQN